MGPVGANASKARAPTVKEPRSGSRMSPEKEGIHQMSGESSSRTRKPEQGLDWGAQVAQGTLLQSKNRLKTNKLNGVCLLGHQMIWKLPSALYLQNPSFLHFLKIVLFHISFLIKEKSFFLCPQIPSSLLNFLLSVLWLLEHICVLPVFSTLKINCNLSPPPLPRAVFIFYS